MRRRSQKPAVIFYVFNNADNLAPGVIAVVSNLFPERIFVWPETTRQGFVDDEDRRRAGRITLRKGAPFTQSRAQRIEVMRLDDVQTDRHKFIRQTGGLIFDFEARVGIGA